MRERRGEPGARNRHWRDGWALLIALREHRAHEELKLAVEDQAQSFSRRAATARIAYAWSRAAAA